MVRIVGKLTNKKTNPFDLLSMQALTFNACTRWYERSCLRPQRHQMPRETMVMSVTLAEDNKLLQLHSQLHCHLMDPLAIHQDA